MALFLNKLLQTMSKFKKIAKISGITLGVVLLILLIAPFVFKGKIVQAIKNTANTQLNANLDFDNDISLSFLRSFPNVSLGIDKLSVVCKDSFAGDTLVYLPQLRLTLDLMSAISGEQIEIKKVYMQQPHINIEYLKSGKANWDIMKPDTTTTTADTAGTFKMALQKLQIEDGHIVYNDRSMDFFAELQHVNHTSNGDFTSDNFTLSTATESKAFTLGYGGVNWLYNINTKIDADLGMDMKAYKFTFEKGKAKLNDLELESNGFVDLNDNDIDMDIQFKALQNTFGSFLSLVPGMYQNNFKDIKTSGTMGFSGFMKGKMTDAAMPAMDVKLNINNGSFSYPSMPYPADNIFLNLHYFNPDGATDHTVVDISKLNLRLAGEPFSMNLLLKTPVSDPYIDAAAKGKLDLSKILGLVPLEKGTKLSGLIDADIAAKGNYSAATSKNFSRLDAKGKLLIKNLLYQSATDKESYNIQDLALNFTPQVIDMPVCKGNIGKNDFDVNGKLQNVLGYAFAGEVLTGTVDFKSNYINVNSFMSDEPVAEEPKATDTGQLSIIELPSNVDLTLNAGIKKLIYDNYVLTNLGGTTHAYNAQLDMKGLTAELLGGKVSLNGTYDSKNVKNPFTTLDTKLERMNLAQSFSYFPMLAKFAPVAKVIDGMFNAKIDMSSILDAYMQPNYNSMNVNGEVSFTDAAVKNLDVLKQIGKQLKVDWLQNLQVKNQQFRFQIKEGVFKLLDSLVLPLGQGATMKLAGMTKLDQTMNYGGWIKIPRKALGQANTVLDGWTKQASAKGWNLTVQEMIPVDLAIVGTILKPEVKVSLKGFAQNTAQQLKDQGTAIVKDEANKKLQEALAKAQVQADKVVAEAKKRADQIRAEGKSAADKVRNETKTKADQIRAEGDKAAQKVIDEANKQAAAVEAKATNPIEKAAAKKAADKIRAEGVKKAESVKGEFYLRARQTEDEGNKRASQIEAEAEKRALQVEDKARSEAEQIMKDAEAKAKL